jgi:hypothetical protein
MLSFVNPNQCPAEGGIPVIITGSGFTDAAGVSFGSQPPGRLTARFTVDSDTQITATAPDSTATYESGSDLVVIVTTRAGSSAAGPAAPTVKFGKARAKPAQPDPGPKEADPDLPDADDQRKDIEHLGKPKTPEDRAKDDDDAMKKALGKLAEATLKQILDSDEGKKIADALDKTPTALKFGVPGAALAAAVTGLALKHGELPVSESPDIPLPIGGSLKVSAKFTWKGPVDKPTEVGLTFSFEGAPSKDSGGDDDPAARARGNDKLKDDLRKWNKGATFPEVPSGPPTPPPRPSSGGKPTLVENFDRKKGKGKRAWNLDKLSRDVSKLSGNGKTGRLQVVAFYDPGNSDDLDDARQGVDVTAKALEQWMPPFKGRIDTVVEMNTGARTFGLTGGDAAAIGTHDMAVIFIP